MSAERQNLERKQEPTIMSIQKKSLISTLKTAKKANVASSRDSEAKGVKVASMRLLKGVTLKQLKSSHTKNFKVPTFKTIA
jgi:hypothetical protein